MCLGSTRILWGIPFQFPARNLENEYLEWFVLEYLMQSLPTKDRQKWNRPVVIRIRFVFIFKHLYYICMFQVIYQTWDAVFHHQMKHREESWKYDAQRSIFDELWGDELHYFIWWWNTVSNVWYFFSNKIIFEGEIKDANTKQCFIRFPNTH